MPDNAPVVPPSQGEGQPVDRIAELEGKLTEAYGKIDKLSSGLNKLFRAEEERTKAPAASSPTQDEPITVRALQKQIQDQMAQQVTQGKREGIQRALSSHGLDAEGVEVLEAYVRVKDDANISFKEGRCWWTNPDDKSDVKPIEDYIAGVVKTKGERFKAPMVAPQGRGLKPGQVRTAAPNVNLFEMSAEDRSKLSKSQRDTIVRQEWARYKSQGK